MKNDSPAPPPDAPPSRFEQRAKRLQERVTDAANAMQAQGIAPTVARLRAALGGGSPNDLAPALKAWRLATGASTVDGRTASARPGSGVPTVIADLVSELWSRAQSAAALDTRSGSEALGRIERTAEARMLRNQIDELRQQIERDAQAYGELKAQAARHEAIAREALDRARLAETRERALLREIGTARARIAELETAAELQKARRPKPSAHRVEAVRSRVTKSRTKTQRTKLRKPQAKRSLSFAAKRKRSVKGRSRPLD